MRSPFYRCAKLKKKPPYLATLILPLFTLQTQRSMTVFFSFLLPPANRRWQNIHNHKNLLWKKIRDFQCCFVDCHVKYFGDFLCFLIAYFSVCLPGWCLISASINLISFAMPTGGYTQTLAYWEGGDKWSYYSPHPWCNTQWWIHTATGI